MSSFAPIFANPDDDVAREIVADALQEKGDPHGTLIALQMSLARLGPDDDDERERLTEEVEAHLAEHGGRICEALGVTEVSCKFVRGFPEEIELTAKQLATRFAHIAERSPVRHVRITHTASGSHNLRVGLPLLAGTTVRSIAFPQAIEEEVVAIFERLALPLESFELGMWSGARPSLLLRTASFRTLRRLAVGAFELRDVVEAMPDTLDELSLGGSSWDATSIDALARAPFVDRLRSLALVNTAIGDDALTRLLPSLKSVRSLDLTACALRSVSALAANRHLDQLATLRLGSNEFDAAAVASLFRIEHLAGLRELRLNILPLGDTGLRALASSGWSSIAHLALGHAELGPAAMTHLAEWIPSSIRALELHDNPLMDRGVAVLARAENLAHLRELGLSRCGLGDGALMALADARLDRLRTLELAHNEHVTEAGCLALAASKSLGRLRMLDLYNVRSGRAGGRALRTRFGQAISR